MPSIRVADYIAQALVVANVTDVFMVTGGGAMHLNDALGNFPGLTVYPCHHEQACAMAAEGYARVSGRMCAVNVTSGPGGLNTLTGLFGAWTDSVPMIVISGQVKRETLVASTGLPLRQLGDQEVNIIGLVSQLTKYAVLVDDPFRVRYQFERAIWAATSGRPGPVWLDVPIDVQNALIDPAELPGFDPAAERLTSVLPDEKLNRLVADVLSGIATAERPVILAGGGIRASGAYEEFLTFIDELGIPVTTGWNAHDLLWDEHPLNVGRPGTVGTRPGNFAVQNSDFVLVLGSRLNIRQIGYAHQTWARGARVAMVDIDTAEMQKPTLRVDIAVPADLREFFQVAGRLMCDMASQDRGAWIAWCKQRVADYPARLPEHDNSEHVNPYVFTDTLFRALPDNQVVVTGDGTACVVTFQAAIVKRGQRLFTNSGAASMGYDLPAAVGAAIAQSASQSVICLAGDGSLMMNLQELATIRGHNLNIKLFVLNNGGYHSIRQTQENYFPGREVGCGRESGLWFPSFEAIATAFCMPYSRIKNHDELPAILDGVLAAEGPQLCEVVLDLNQQFAPKAASKVLPDGSMVSAPLEDLAPFLDRTELRANMLIPLLNE